jgi:hypothetical protein
MPRHSALPPNLAPRLIPREASAEYISVSPAKFDQMVGDGRMPKPRTIDRRRVWDIVELDVAVAALPHEGDEGGDNSWDEVLRK